MDGSRNQNLSDLKEVFPMVKIGEALRKISYSFCVPLVKVYPKSKYSTKVNMEEK